MPARGAGSVAEPPARRAAGGRATEAIRPIVVLVALIIAVSAPRPAEAYLDPGTGSFAFQAVVAAIVAGAFFARRWLWRLRDWARSRFSSSLPAGPSRAKPDAEGRDRSNPPR
jgi:O-antigen/teichoic acid export membrane protein